MSLRYDITNQRLSVIVQRVEKLVRGGEGLESEGVGV